jgi:predicted histidine transporter YuiF (NhaC family)
VNHKYNMLVPAGLFIGMGIGMAMGNLVAGLFIGLGTGFLFSTIVYMIGANKKE